MFRFYGNLNDFLHRHKRNRWIKYTYSGKPSVKDAIEAIGVPHPEIGIILVNGQDVSWNEHLTGDEQVEVAPQVQASSAIGPMATFILDVHLGGLAKRLRMLGFDTLYDNRYEDAHMVEVAEAEGRILLTRDLPLLKRKQLTRGYWLRSQNTEEQLREVLLQFNLMPHCKPFLRCIACNGKISGVAKSQVNSLLEEGTRASFDEFYQCSQCCKVYWKGSHYEHMEHWLHAFKNSL